MTVKITGRMTAIFIGVCAIIVSTILSMSFSASSGTGSSHSDSADSGSAEETPVWIQYVSDKEYGIDFGKYAVGLYYTDSEKDDQHNWNIGGVNYGDTVVVTRGTDILGPIKIKGDKDFLSGIHGSSTTRQIAVYCDGREVQLDKNLHAACEKLVITMTDECRSEATRAHVFDRYVTIEITYNAMHVMNTFRCVAEDGVTVERATNGGLIAVRNNILTGVSMNNLILTAAPETAVHNSSRSNTHAVFNLTMGTITVDNLVGHEQDSYRGFFAVFVNENPIRTKSYFDVIASDKPVVKGEEITGEFVYRFS